MPDPTENQPADHPFPPLTGPVLVTGGAGFIGSHLVEALVASGLETRVLDDLSSGRPANLAAVAERIDLRVGDILDQKLLAELLRGATTVFHLAALASVPLSRTDPERCLEINGLGALRVMRSAADAGVRRLVYASSSAVYGDLPAPHDESLAPRPDTPYAAIKLLGEHLGLFLNGASPMVTVSLRYFNVYGPRQSADGPDAGVIPVFLKALADRRPPVIYGDGSQTRDFVHVSDVVRANLLAATAPDVGADPLNVASGREVSVNELLRLMAVGFPGAPAPILAPARAGDPPRSLGSVSLAAAKLGFRTRITLADGLAELATINRQVESTETQG